MSDMDIVAEALKRANTGVNVGFSWRADAKILADEVERLRGKLDEASDLADDMIKLVRQLREESK